MAYSRRLCTSPFSRQEGLRVCILQSSQPSKHVCGILLCNLFCGWQAQSSNNLFPPTEKEGLYPLQALVQPIAPRLKYHFDGSRQTNKLEKVGTFICLYPCAKAYNSLSGTSHICRMLAMSRRHSWMSSFKGYLKRQNISEYRHGYACSIFAPFTALNVP